MEVTLKALLEAGCHFGHQVNRWHPKANQFIYQTRQGIHIIDLIKTKTALGVASIFLCELARRNGSLLMVCTKRQGKGIVSEEASKVGASYLTQRWIGGLLTNWEAVKKNIEKLNKMKQESKTGTWQKFPKHERLKLTKTVKSLERFYGGVANLSSLPDCLYIVDIRRERVALLEARKKNIPIVAIVDTNSDPNLVDYPIPANDDAVGSIKIITSFLAQAYQQGRDEAAKQPKSKSKKEKKTNKVSKKVD